MSDSVTLPREVVQDALDALTGADDFSPGGTPIYMHEITALRKALAAEQPKPSGTPIEKIVEEMIAESPEMALYLPDARRQYILDAARYRWLREWMVRHSILCLEYGGRWALRKPHFISSSVGCGETEDAAIDAAMAQDKR